MRTSHLARKGFTLIELLVVISIIGVLAGLLVPAITRAMAKSKMTACGNNLKQIATMMVAYRDEYGTAPFSSADVTYSGGSWQAASDAGTAKTWTGYAFQVLMAYDRENITGKLFRCPAGGPQALDKMIPNDDLHSSPAATSTSFAHSYAFDWSAPGIPGAARVILGDRSPQTHGGDTVMVSFGDAHFEMYEAEEIDSGNLASGGTETAGYTFNEKTTKCFNNPAARGAVDDSNDDMADNIFTDEGDYDSSGDNGMLKFQGGHGLRCFLK